MKQEEYRSCMKPYISGHHENRKLSFCAGAKMCTGKASNLADAEKICREQPPKPPKEKKTRRSSKKDEGVELNIDALAVCVLSKISCENLTVEKLTEQINECLGAGSSEDNLLAEAEQILKDKPKKKTPMMDSIMGDDKVPPPFSAGGAF
jgi:aldehyde:ferredoxin oxidoreductase